MIVAKRIAKKDLRSRGQIAVCWVRSWARNLQATNGHLNSFASAHVDLRDTVDMYRFFLAMRLRRVVDPRYPGNYSLALPLKVASMVLFVMLGDV